MSEKKLLRKIQHDFLIAVGFTLLLVLLSYFLSYRGFIIYKDTVNNPLKTIVILYVLCSIPISLKWFSGRLVKISENEDIKFKSREYIKIHRIRFSLILFGVLFAAMSYFIQGMQDMLYMIAIELVILILCLPTKKRIGADWTVLNNGKEN